MARTTAQLSAGVRLADYLTIGYPGDVVSCGKSPGCLGVTRRTKTATTRATA